MVGHESLDCWLLLLGFAMFVVLYTGKKALCFFGIHHWEQNDDGWSMTCSRCKRFYLETPVGGFESPSWFRFWFRGER